MTKKKFVAIPLAVLRSGDKKALKNYGPQPLTAGEIAQRRKDEMEAQAFDKEREKTAHHGQRITAYPSVGDQLDEIWRALASLAAGEPMPVSTFDMMKKLQAIKKKHPKPKG